MSATSSLRNASRRTARGGVRPSELNCAAAVTPSTERPPDVPGFADLRRLGSGGAGRVFQAQDLACARSVAIKVLWAPGSPAVAERFQREIRVAAGLSHPNLVPVYTAGTTREGAL